MKTEEEARKFLLDAGYPDVFSRLLPDGRVAWVYRFLFTFAILVAEPESGGLGYSDRWCYGKEADARAALTVWNPESEKEPQGWHRHPSSGRRRPAGDASKEYINF